MRTGSGNRWKLCTGGGLLLIAAALCLVLYNGIESRGAGRQAAQALEALAQQDAAETPETAGTAATLAAYLRDKTMAMPEQEVDGVAYIGTLELPALELSLPVASEWSYERLRTAPCRYQGSAYQDTMIIAGHNYQTHFGALHTLKEGDAVYFSDLAGSRFFYTVAEIEELDGQAVEEMEAGDWDLTLFTCTVGGGARVTVRCEKVWEPIPGEM